MKLSIIIPNYNGESFIRKTILSLLNGFNNCTVIVIDDASTDNSVEVINLIDNNRLHLISKPKNGGFASSINLGIEHCIQNQMEFALIANSDIDITLNNCKEILEAVSAFSDHDVAVLGFLETANVFSKEGKNISGFLFALRLGVIADIGYFDETFYMYGEEQDFFNRVDLHGYKIKQTGIVVHHASEMSSTSNDFNSWLSIRNSIYLSVKLKNALVILKKVLVLFCLINRLYRRSDNDVSLQRIRRIGIIKGNVNLFNAVIWNIKKMRKDSVKPE